MPEYPISQGQKHQSFRTGHRVIHINAPRYGVVVGQHNQPEILVKWDAHPRAVNVPREYLKIIKD